MAKTTLRISCGCNSDTTPALFNTIVEAEKHADQTGHILTVLGTISSK